MTTENGLLVLLQGRSKDLPRDRYAYELNAPGQFGLDVIGSTEPEVDESTMSFLLPFADGHRRDGVGDLLEVGGIDCSRHRLNPISLFDHGKQLSLPIGLCEDPQTKQYTVSIDPVAKTATARVFVYQGTPGASALKVTGTDGVTPYDHALFCQQLFDLWAKKYIRAGSIGYQVKAARELSPDYETGTPKGLHLLNVLMLEASAVVLPANADTVSKCLSLASVCGKPLSPYLRKSLEPYAGEKKVMLGYEERQGKDVEVPVPHGDLTKTEIPPVDWKPGLGADCKDMGDYPAVREDVSMPEQKSLNADGVLTAAMGGDWDIVTDMLQDLGKSRSEADTIVAKLKQVVDVSSRPGEWSNEANRRSLLQSALRNAGVKSLRTEEKAFGFDDAAILGLIGMGTMTIAHLLKQVMRWYHNVDEETFNQRLQDLQAQGKITIHEGVVSAVQPTPQKRLKDLRNRYRKALGNSVGDKVTLYDGEMGEVIAVDPAHGSITVRLLDGRQAIVQQYQIATATPKSLPVRRKDMPKDPAACKIIEQLMFGTIKPNDAYQQLLKAGMRKQDAEREVRTTVQAMGQYPWDGKAWRVERESDGWWLRGDHEHKDDQGPFSSKAEALHELTYLSGFSPPFGVGQVERYDEDYGKSLEVKFNWADNPNGTPRENRRIWISNNGDSPRQVTFRELESMLGEEKAKLAISTSIRKGTGVWHDVKSLLGSKSVRTTKRKSWDATKTKDKDLASAVIEWMGFGNHGRFSARLMPDRQWWVVDDDGSKFSGPYESQDEAMGEVQKANNVRALARQPQGQKSLTFAVIGAISWFLAGTSVGIHLPDLVDWLMGENKVTKETDAYLAIKQMEREGKIQIIDGKVYLKSPTQGQKSLDLSSTRKKYRPTKGLRRRLRKSAPGVSVMHVAAKDIDAARELAETSGLKFAHVGNSGGFAKVKLTGADDGIDTVAREFGKRIKSLGGTAVKKQGKDIRTVNNRAGGGIDIDPNLRRMLNNAGAEFNYAKPGNSGEGHVLYYPRGFDFTKVEQVLDRAGYSYHRTGDGGIHVKPKSLKPIKNLNTRGKSMDEDLELDDVTEEKDMSDPSNWPYGAQVAQRVIEDHKQLLQDYDEHHGPLEHEGLKKLFQKKLEAIVSDLDEWEAAVGKHYPDIAHHIVGETDNKDLTDEEAGEVEGELDALGDELDAVEDDLGEEFEDTESKDMDTMDDNGVPADSDPEAEPTPEEALEGMETKRLSRRVKLLRARRKALEEEEEKETKRLRMLRKSACPCGKDPCDCDKGKRLIRRKDFEDDMIASDSPVDDVPEKEDMFGKGLEEHELAKVGEASEHAKTLSGMEQLDEESRMKSFHYHKTLEGMGQIEDMAAEGKSEFVGDPGFWAEEGAETEHKDLPPNEVEMPMPSPDAMNGNAPPKSMHPHRQACKDASQFFGDAARTKDWGEAHRQNATAVAKALDEITAAPPDATSPPEEAGFEVGEMGEKKFRPGERVADLRYQNDTGKRREGVVVKTNSREGRNIVWIKFDDGMTQGTEEDFVEQVKSIKRKSVEDEDKKKEDEKKSITALKKSIAERERQIKELRRVQNGIAKLATR